MFFLELKLFFANAWDDTMIMVKHDNLFPIWQITPIAEDQSGIVLQRLANAPDACEKSVIWGYLFGGVHMAIYAVVFHTPTSFFFYPFNHFTRLKLKLPIECCCFK